MDIDDLGFAGKTVSFGSAGDTLAIKNIKFKFQNEKLFVVGEVPKGATNNNWAAGRPCAIAWETITEYMIFDSEELYVTALEKS